MLKIIKRYLRQRYVKHYRRRRWQLFLDITLAITILVLAITTFILTYFKPSLINYPQFLPGISKPQPPIKDEEFTEHSPLEINLITFAQNYASIDLIPLQIKLHNRSSKLKIESIQLKLNSARDNFTISLIENSILDSDLKINDNVINLHKLEPEESKEIILKLEFKKLHSQDRNLLLVLDFNYQFAQEIFNEQIHSQYLKVQADPQDIEASVQLYYNSPSGDQLGSGPLPLVSGLPTNFWVFVKINPKTSLTNFVFSAKLASHVSFVNNFSVLAGKLNFNPDSRQIIWQIDDLNLQEEAYQANFELQLIPHEQQIGSLANLLENIRIQATDLLTDFKLVKDLPYLNTSLSHDLINKGQGIVIDSSDYFTSLNHENHEENYDNGDN